MSHQEPDSHNDPAPDFGTVKAARYRRAGCGIRYTEDELKAGVDFSGATQLLEGEEAPGSTAAHNPQSKAASPSAQRRDCQ